MIQVGDMIEIITNSSSHEFKIGSIVMVEDVNSSREGLYAIGLDKLGNYDVWFVIEGDYILWQSIDYLYKDVPY